MLAGLEVTGIQVFLWKKASMETEKSPHDSKGLQSQPEPQLELGTPIQAETTSYERTKGFISPKAAPADQAEKVYEPAPEQEETLDLRDLAENLEEFELDYDDSLLTADEAYGGAEEYIIAADLAKQAAEAANLADAAQDEVISHLVVARRLAREAEALKERKADQRIAAQSLDQLTKVTDEITQDIQASRKRLAQQELDFYQAEQAAAKALRSSQNSLRSRYQEQEHKLAGIKEEKVALLMAAADHEGSLAELEAIITDNDNQASAALPCGDRLRHQNKYLARDIEREQRKAQRFDHEAAAERSGIQSKEAQLARLQDELAEVDRGFHELQQTVKEVRAENVERGLPKDTSTDGLQKRLQDLNQDVDALLSWATELAASEEGEEPAELTYAAVVVTTPDTQEGGRPRSEADDVFVPSPQYQQLKGSWHEDLAAEDPSQTAATAVPMVLPDGTVAMTLERPVGVTH